jgi:hypothetical protein
LASAAISDEQANAISRAGIINRAFISVTSLPDPCDEAMVAPAKIINIKIYKLIRLLTSAWCSDLPCGTRTGSRPY